MSHLSTDFLFAHSRTAAQSVTASERRPHFHKYNKLCALNYFHHLVPWCFFLHQFCLRDVYKHSLEGAVFLYFVVVASLMPHAVFCCCSIVNVHLTTCKHVDGGGDKNIN